MRIRKAQVQEIMAQVRREKRAELVYGLGRDDPTARIDPAAGTAVLTDARGHASTVEFSDQGVAGIRTAMGRQYRFGRDAAGRVTTLEAQGHLRYDMAYTEGALTEIRRDGKSLLRLAYNPPEGMVEVRFPDDNVEKLQFDLTGQHLLKTTDALGHETQLVRDSAGRVVELRDPRGHSTIFGYDEEGDPNAARFPDGTIEEYKATDDGTDILLNGNPHASVVTTDDGELESVTFADGHEVRLRFVQGVPLEGTNASHQVKFAYDEEGRMLEEELDGQRIEFLYDVDGNLAELKGPAGPIRYRYDGDDLLTSISTWDGAEIKFAYAMSGQIRQIEFPNGVTTVVDATPAGHVRAITTAGAVGGARAIVRDAYEYDRRDRVSTRRRHEQELMFGYDPTGRLTEVRHAVDPPGGRGDSTWQVDERYAYDAVGNRTGANGRTAAFDAMNKLMRDGAETFRHDAAGNLIARSGGSAPYGAATYRYNGQGLLTEAVGADERAVRFTYDAFGRRVSKQAGVYLTRYTWAGRQLLREEMTREGKPVERRDYLYYPGEHLPLAVLVNGKSYYYHTDRAGTVLAMTDARGQVVWQADYSAFGEVTLRVETVPQPLRSLGHYGDTETGLYYNLFRYYDPRLGRYLTPDPIRYESGSTNFYLYANNDPVNQRDPEGHIVIPAALLIIAGAAVLGGLIGGAINAAQGGSFWKGAAAGAVAGAIGAAAPILGAAAGLGGAALAAVALAGDAIAGGAEACIEGEASLGAFAKGAGIALVTTVATLGLAKIPGVKKALGAVGKRLAGLTDDALKSTKKFASRKVTDLKRLYYKARPKEFAKKVSASRARPAGHAKPWDQMTPGEKKAFQHSYNRHASDFGLPPWKQSEAPKLQSQYNAATQNVRDSAQTQKISRKPYGQKGSGKTGDTVEVLEYRHTDSKGDTYYYYESLDDGTFISSGKAN